MPEDEPVRPEVGAGQPWSLVDRLRLVDVRQWAGAVAAAVALGAAGLVFLRGAPRPPEADLPVATVVGERSDAGATAPTTTAGHVLVHAAGAVASPGVYRLPAGARVADLIDVAGGATAEADLDQLNLAARLEDGTRVRVPRRGEAADPTAASGAPVATATPRILDLNTATAEQLDALPGVGPSTAKAIVDWRTANGRFRSVHQLLEVRGIGEAKLEQIRPLVRV